MKTANACARLMGQERWEEIALPYFGLPMNGLRMWRALLGKKKKKRDMFFLFSFGLFINDSTRADPTPSNSAMSNPMFPWGNMSLKECDPIIYELAEREKNRQWRGLELIASEVRNP
jgi:hypothetical protein